jgi:hypothetical protein
LDMRPPQIRWQLECMHIYSRKQGTSERTTWRSSKIDEATAFSFQHCASRLRRFGSPTSVRILLSQGIGNNRWSGREKKKNWSKRYDGVDMGASVLYRTQQRQPQQFVKSIWLLNYTSSCFFPWKRSVNITDGLWTGKEKVVFTHKQKKKLPPYLLIL